MKANVAITRGRDRFVEVPLGFVRIPGLFRRTELEPMDRLEAGFHVVDAGTGPDGEALVAVFQREQPPQQSRAAAPETPPVSAEILLPEAPERHGRLTVRYCDACHRWGQKRSVHLCGVNWHRQLDHLLREIAAEAAHAEGRAAQ